MSDQTLLVDVTQYVGQPAATGIQRVLGDVLTALDLTTGRVLAGYQHEGLYRFVAPGTAVATIKALFMDAGLIEDRALHVWNAFESAKLFELPAAEIDLLIDSYLLPEPTYREDVLATANGLRKSGIPVSALVYDLLPATRPHLFRGRHQASTDGYFRFLATCDNIAAISAGVLAEIESRLRRRPVPNRATLPPPVERDEAALDGGRADVDLQHFVHLGTIEPRKQVGTLLDAFAILWRNGGDQQLTLVGRWGWDSTAILDRLEVLEQREPRFNWLREASDETAKEALRGAAACLYLSRDEGYGLPPLEALAAGVPVIVSDALPALENIGPEGQIRLFESDPEAVADAVSELSDADVNRRLRAEAAGLRLPRFGDFAAGLQAWLNLGPRTRPTPPARV
jgi:glycosyltransferase involved in cell wall biosynthesis